MRRWIVLLGVLVGLGTAAVAWAACTTTTTWTDGKFCTCTTCCDSFGNCTESCWGTGC